MFIDIYEPPSTTRPCYVCGATSAAESYVGCICTDEDECPRCESYHPAELPCVAMSAEAEDRRTLRV